MAAFTCNRSSSTPFSSDERRRRVSAKDRKGQRACSKRRYYDLMRSLLQEGSGAKPARQARRADDDAAFLYSQVDVICRNKWFTQANAFDSLRLAAATQPISELHEDFILDTGWSGDNKHLLLSETAR